MVGQRLFLINVVHELEFPAWDIPHHLHHLEDVVVVDLWHCEQIYVFWCCVWMLSLNNHQPHWGQWSCDQILHLIHHLHMS